MNDLPIFPIYVTSYFSDGDVIKYTLNNESEICGSLEYFGLEEDEEDTLNDYDVVIDAKGRDVILVVEHLEIKEFRLK